MNPFMFLSDIMLDAVKFFAAFGGYGWGIVWLTIAVNLALYPLTLSSVKSMGALQRLQPKTKELQKKHKDNPQELQKKTMELYKSEKINPLGGCLPMLLKIPFFIALFLAFQSPAFLEIASNPENNTSFLWISGRIEASVFDSPQLVADLEKANMLIKDEKKSISSGKEQFVWNAAMKIGDKHLKDVLTGVNPKNDEDVKKVQGLLAEKIPGLSADDTAGTIMAWEETSSLAKPEFLVLFGKPIRIFGILFPTFAILIAISTFFMQKSMPTAGAGQQAQMMTWFMPLFIGFIGYRFLAGVQLYWIVSNLVGAGQQYLIMRKTSSKRSKA